MVFAGYWFERESVCFFRAYSLHQTRLFIVVVVTFLIGLVGILFASYRLSKPIMRLSDEAAKAQLDKGMRDLSTRGFVRLTGLWTLFPVLGRK